MSLSLRSDLRASALAALCVLGAACSRQPEFDLVIRGGDVHDGTGGVDGIRRADVGLKGDRITAIGDLSQRRAADSIDATGKVVAPGFIDARGQSGVTLLADGYAESHLRQGITSEIIGDNSPAFWTMRTPDVASLQRYGVAFDWNGFAGYFQKLESRGISINVGTLVPISLSRLEGGGAFIDAAMRAGALGVVNDSGGPVGLSGPAVASVVAVSGGVFMSPLRSGAPPAEATEEIMSTAAQMQAATVVVSDLMLIEPPDAMTTSQVVTRMVAAGQRGLRVFGTAAPYPAMPSGPDVPAREAMKYGGVTIGTNTTASTASAPAAQTRPAAFGAFPRLLGQWVRDEHVLELREAVRRLTSLPASIFSLPQRGIIRENYFADIVVFDPASVADRATFEKPNEYPAGIDYVIVNGVVTLTPQGLTGARAGHRLLGPAARRPGS
jgi:N-acyl-D-amino-acid deacylase